MVNLDHGELGKFPDECNEKVDDSADRGEVVDRHQGIHLELGRAKKSLDHGESESLKDDTPNLVDEADPYELDLAKRSNDDTNDNDRDVQKDLQVGLSNTQSPAREKNSYRSCRLGGVSRTG